MALPREVEEWCKATYPRLMRNEKACMRLYYAIHRRPLEKKKIADLQPGDKATIEGVVIDRFLTSYDGCPETLRKGACDDGSIGVINVYIFEVADETSSIRALAIVPAYTEFDELLGTIDPGDEVRMSGRVVESENPRTGEKELRFNIYRRGRSIIILRKLNPAPTGEDSSSGSAVEPETPASAELPGQEASGEEHVGVVSGPSPVDRVVEYLRMVKRVRKSTFMSVLKSYGVDWSLVEPLVKVENDIVTLREE